MPGADSVVLTEQWGAGESPVAWVAHPSASGIGYRRPSAGVASSGSTAAIPASPGNQPVMDSGTSDASDADELNRVENYDTGGNQNPNVTQSAPISRAVQQAAGMDGPGLVGLGGPIIQGGGLTIEGVMNDNLGPWRTGIGHQGNIGGYFFEGLPNSRSGQTSPGTAWSGRGANGSSQPQPPAGQGRAGVSGLDGLVPGTHFDPPAGPPNPVPGSQTPPPMATQPPSNPANGQPLGPQGAPANGQPPGTDGSGGPTPAQVSETVADLIEIALDISGLFDPTPFSDGASGILLLTRGEYWSAGISLVSVIPFIGDAAKIGKFGKYAQKVAKAIELAKTAAGNKVLMPLLMRLKNLLKGLPLGKLPRALREPLEKIMKMLDELSEKVGDELPTKQLSCFTAGTPVAASDGLRPIETIRVGHWVWAFDVVAGEWRLCRASYPYKMEYDGMLVLITIAGETTEATYRHPYWVVRGEELDSRPRLEHLPSVPAGATAVGRWVDSCDLRVGDEVLLRDGRIVPVDATALRRFTGTVYNMEVEGLRCYAVGRSGVLVHNQNAKDTGLGTSGPTPAGAAPNTPGPLGRGSTANLSKGTTLPRNLREQLAVEHVLSSPTSGSQLPLRMTDPRWPAGDGWVKMQQVVQSGGREGPVNVHYVYNTVTGAIDDLKVVLPGVR